MYVCCWYATQADFFESEIAAIVTTIKHPPRSGLGLNGPACAWLLAHCLAQVSGCCCCRTHVPSSSSDQTAHFLFPMPLPNNPHKTSPDYNIAVVEDAAAVVQVAFPTSCVCCLQHQARAWCTSLAQREVEGAEYRT